MTRNCHSCMSKGVLGVPATHVACDADGLQWFECGKHEPRDNTAHKKRVSLTPIDEWLRQHRLVRS